MIFKNQIYDSLRFEFFSILIYWFYESLLLILKKQFSILSIGITSFMF